MITTYAGFLLSHWICRVLWPRDLACCVAILLNYAFSPFICTFWNRLNSLIHTFKHEVAQWIFATTGISFIWRSLENWSIFSIEWNAASEAITSVCFVEILRRKVSELCQCTKLTVSRPSARNMRTSTWQCFVRSFWYNLSANTPIQIVEKLSFLSGGQKLLFDIALFKASCVLYRVNTRTCGRFQLLWSETEAPNAWNELVQVAT